MTRLFVFLLLGILIDNIEQKPMLPKKSLPKFHKLHSKYSGQNTRIAVSGSLEGEGVPDHLLYSEINGDFGKKVSTEKLKQLKVRKQTEEKSKVFQQEMKLRLHKKINHTNQKIENPVRIRKLFNRKLSSRFVQRGVRDYELTAPSVQIPGYICFADNKIQNLTEEEEKIKIKDIKMTNSSYTNTVNDAEIRKNHTVKKITEEQSEEILTQVSVVTEVSEVTERTRISKSFRSSAKDLVTDAIPSTEHRELIKSLGAVEDNIPAPEIFKIQEVPATEVVIKVDSSAAKISVSKTDLEKDKSRMTTAKDKTTTEANEAVEVLSTTVRICKPEESSVTRNGDTTNIVTAEGITSTDVAGDKNVATTERKTGEIITLKKDFSTEADFASSPEFIAIEDLSAIENFVTEEEIGTIQSVPFTTKVSATEYLSLAEDKAVTAKKDGKEFTVTETSFTEKVTDGDFGEISARRKFGVKGTMPSDKNDGVDMEELTETTEETASTIESTGITQATIIETDVIGSNIFNTDVDTNEKYMDKLGNIAKNNAENTFIKEMMGEEEQEIKEVPPLSATVQKAESSEETKEFELNNKGVVTQALASSVRYKIADKILSIGENKLKGSLTESDASYFSGRKGFGAEDAVRENREIREFDFMKGDNKLPNKGFDVQVREHEIETSVRNLKPLKHTMYEPTWSYFKHRRPGVREKSITSQKFSLKGKSSMKRKSDFKIRQNMHYLDLITNEGYKDEEEISTDGSHAINCCEIKAAISDKELPVLKNKETNEFSENLHSYKPDTDKTGSFPSVDSMFIRESIGEDKLESKEVTVSLMSAAMQYELPIAEINLKKGADFNEEYNKDLRLNHQTDNAGRLLGVNEVSLDNEAHIPPIELNVDETIGSDPQIGSSGEEYKDIDGEKISDQIPERDASHGDFHRKKRKETAKYHLLYKVNDQTMKI